MTNSLEKRVWEHKNHSLPGFTSKYNCEWLVYFEVFGDVNQTIARETQIKTWSRAKKEALIDAMNPEWTDLSRDWYREVPDPTLGISRRATPASRVSPARNDKKPSSK